MSAEERESFFEKDMGPFHHYEIFKQARNRNVEILKYKEAFTLKDYKNRLPIHYLAGYSISEVLNYPECFEVQDIEGETIFHALAKSGCLKILNYSETYKQISKKFRTPIDILISNIDIKISMLPEEYQRRARILRFEEDRILTVEDFQNLLKAPNSLLFILEMADSREI